MNDTVLPAGRAAPRAARLPEGELAGDLTIWVIILAELAAFGLLFLSYAFARSAQVALFNASQQTLDLNLGAVNTVLLISGSGCVARAVRAVRQDQGRSGVRWLAGAVLCGGAFLALKASEYAAKFQAGLDLETNAFYMFYFLLTGFHFLHVAAATVALAILGVRTAQGAYGSRNCHALETGAAFWHMVDLLWIVLFPLVYVMR